MRCDGSATVSASSSGDSFARMPPLTRRSPAAPGTGRPLPGSSSSAAKTRTAPKLVSAPTVAAGA